MDRDAFVQLVDEAIKSIPERFRAKISNVAFLVEHGERSPTGDERVILHAGQLLGLYQGIALPHRSEHYHMALPDRITIFQQPIEELANGDPDRMRQIVKETVQHELAHYFGMSEREVRQWEHKRKHRTQNTS